MLSFSNFAREASRRRQGAAGCHIVARADPELQVDGEMQADNGGRGADPDAGVTPSQAAGPANVLIFPDLMLPTSRTSCSPPRGRPGN